MTVAAFHREMKLSKFRVRLVFAQVKVHALGNQPVDGLLGAFDREADCGLVTEACTRGQRVRHMRLYRVSVMENRCHAALRPKGRACSELAFADHGNPHVGRQL